MSRCEASDTLEGKGHPDRRRGSFRGAALVAAAGALGTSVLGLLVAATSCGGTQAPAPAVGGDAAVDVDAGPPLADDDACAIQSAFAYQPIVGFEGNNTFDLAASPNPTPDNGGVNPSYVSFDLTGVMFGCTTGCDIQVADMDFTGDGGGGIGGCVTGYNPVAEKLASGDPGHCLLDGGHAKEGIHLRAQGLTNWGMNLGMDLRQNCYNNNMTVGDNPAIDAGFPNQPCYFDARPWTGISLWARLGSSDSVTNAIITISDPDTAGQLGGTYPFNALTCGSSPCGSMPPTQAPFQCDPFGKAITLSSDWQFYRIPFTDMVQKGYGLPESAPDLAHFIGVKVNLSRGQLGTADYDVWFNDFAFYK